MNKKLPIIYNKIYANTKIFVMVTEIVINKQINVFVQYILCIILFQNEYEYPDCKVKK